MDLLIRALLVAALLGACNTEGDVLGARNGDGDGGGSGTDGGGSGVDSADGCPLQPDCPQPPSGDITLCGRVVDLETSQPITTDPPDVRVFDPTKLRQDPLNAVELAVVTPDVCGYFTTTIDGSSEGLVVHTGSIPIFSNDPRRVISLVMTQPGQVYRQNAWVLGRTVDQRWSTDANLSGPSFAESGSILPIFVNVNQQAPDGSPLQGVPVAGVAMTADGSALTDGAYYFSDADSLTRSTVAPAQMTTGTNGSGLWRSAGGAFSMLSGTKTSCTFPKAQGSVILGMVQVQEIAGSCN